MNDVENFENEGILVEIFQDGPSLIDVRAKTTDKIIFRNVSTENAIVNFRDIFTTQGMLTIYLAPKQQYVLSNLTDGVHEFKMIMGGWGRHVSCGRVVVGESDLPLKENDKCQPLEKEWSWM